MKAQQKLDYARVEKAIVFIRKNLQCQPSLDEVSAHLGLSPFHFQKLFSEWAGVSPKKFLQYLSLEHAKRLLKNNDVSLMDAAYETGLSGTSRLHDLFVKIEAMTPGEFKNGGSGLLINYDISESPFGQVLVASTAKGICHMMFIENESSGLQNLKSRFPKASFQAASDVHQHAALAVFGAGKQLSKIRVHLQGSAFQLKVWSSLLKIPGGALASYGDVAKDIGNPKSARAVGTAIATNPVAFLIPCHRVIQRSGNLGGYRWGEARKSLMIGWEAAEVMAR